MKAKNLMNKDIPTIYWETNVGKICGLLTRKKISGLPVIDNKGKLVGFVSERDTIATVNSKNFLQKKAKDIMAKQVVFVEENASIDEVMSILAEKQYRHIPVTRNGKVVGMISRKKIVDKFLSYYY